MWDLLADVGGFKDGLMILGLLLTSLYANLSFKSDFLNGTPIDGGRDNKIHRFSQLTTHYNAKVFE